MRSARRGICEAFGRLFTYLWHVVVVLRDVWSCMGPDKSFLTQDEDLSSALERERKDCEKLDVLAFLESNFLKFFMNILHSKIRVFEDILFWNYVTMCPPIFSRKFSTIGKIGKIWRNTIGIHVCVCVCVIYESRYSRRSFTSPWSKVFTAQTDIFVYSLFLYSTFQFRDFSHTLNGKLNSPLISPVHKFCYNLITDHPIFFPSNLHLINYLLKAIS